MAKDRLGLEYSELLQIQGRHLTIWKERLKPAVFGPVADYVHAKNVEANGPEQKHQVFRGQDLIQIIMDWPELNPAYPPIKDDATSLI